MRDMLLTCTTVCCMCFKVDMDCLTDGFCKEQKEYYLHTAQWMNVHPQQLLGSPSCIKKYDLHTLTLEELQVRLCVLVCAQSACM